MVELSNGAKIEYDWSAITQKEWRMLLDKETGVETNDIIVGKLIGMTADELAELNPLDYRKVALGIWESFRKETSFDESKN
jgi:hypothetical protein